MSADLDALTAPLAEQLVANDNAAAANDNIDPRSLPVRFSRLKLMSQSAAHYYADCQRELAGDDDDKGATLRIGSAVHAIVLGTPPVIRFSERRAGKAWDMFKLEHAGKLILNDREWWESMAMASAVTRRKEAMQILFEDSIIEQRIDWSYLGRACRSTPDSRSEHWVAELKTARTSNPAAFVRDGLRFQYHVQLAAYLDAIEHETKRRPSKAYIVVVESKRPNPVSIFRVTDRALEQGAKTFRLWFERLLICEQSNSWPEYTDGIVDFDLPELPEPVEIEIDGKIIQV